MLSFVANIAVVSLTEWLLVAAWLIGKRDAPNNIAWPYYVLAGFVVFMWGQPWNRSDPYRTDNPQYRLITYAILALATVSSTYVFKIMPPLAILVEVLILAGLEITGRTKNRQY